MRNAFRILVGKPEGKRPIGRSWTTWEYYKIKMNFWEGVDWTHLVQDRGQWQALVNMVSNLHVP
jgi:hypothetical protein